MTGRLSASVYLAIVALGFLVLCAASLALPHDPYIRWQSFQGTMFERTRYQYERLHFDSAPIDVVFIGSSRTAAGIDPGLLEAALSERGQSLRVIDMSLPASGMDIRMAQAREALRARPGVKLLVIAVVEALPRDGHQAFGELATGTEILSGPLLVNRNYPANLARLPMRQIKLATASVLPEAFGYQARFNPKSYPGSSYDFSGGNTMDGALETYRLPAHAEALRQEARQRRREITPQILPEALAFLEFGVSRSSLLEIIAMAGANGTRVAFMHLPFFEGYAQPRDADWLATHANVWTADWMRTRPEYYKDAAHASPLVKERLNAWAAERIIEELGLTKAMPQQSEGE
jgi:hypothetical protein